jgi:hypothetical protein
MSGLLEQFVDGVMGVGSWLVQTLNNYSTEAFMIGANALLFSTKRGRSLMISTFAFVIAVLLAEVMLVLTLNRKRFVDDVTSLWEDYRDFISEFLKKETFK